MRKERKRAVCLLWGAASGDGRKNGGKGEELNGGGREVTSGEGGGGVMESACWSGSSIASGTVLFCC